jgi:hypothetical protein
VDQPTPACRALVPALVAALALGGCGSSHSAPPHPTGQQQIAQVLRSYLSAQTQGDGQTACSLLTAAGQRELEALVVKEAKGLVPFTPSCQDAVGLVHTFAGSKLLDALGSARIEQVQAHGTTGSAVVADATAFKPQTVSLVKVGGAWRIAGVPGLAG